MFIDIHSHILCHIDDGAVDYDTSIKMLSLAAESGTSHIIATPHFIYKSSAHGFSSIAEQCNELQNGILKSRMGITVHSGQEVFLSPELERLYDERIIGTIAGSRYMLVEFPMMSIPVYAEDVLYSLQLKGIVPIIAHPERNLELKAAPGLLKNLVQRGILAQINSGSITGLYGKEIQKVANNLINMGIVHFVASDAHNLNSRSPCLNFAARIIEKTHGKSVMEELLINNGLRLIGNEEIKPVMKNKENILSRIFKKNRIIAAQE